jgi:methionine sulfoxide reductase heme-binding subunit
LGYVVIAVMAATSNDWAVTRLGPKNWQRLHTFGAYYVWLIFALTYLSRVKEPGGTGYDVLFAIILSVLLLRVFALLFRRSPRTDELFQQAPAVNR